MSLPGFFAGRLLSLAGLVVARCLSLAGDCPELPAVPAGLPEIACSPALPAPFPARSAVLPAHFLSLAGLVAARCLSLSGDCPELPAVPAGLPETPCIAALPAPFPARSAVLAGRSPPALRRAPRSPPCSQEQPPPSKLPSSLCFPPPCVCSLSGFYRPRPAPLLPVNNRIMRLISATSFSKKCGTHQSCQVANTTTILRRGSMLMTQTGYFMLCFTKS